MRNFKQHIAFVLFLLVAIQTSVNSLHYIVFEHDGKTSEVNFTNQLKPDLTSHNCDDFLFYSDKKLLFKNDYSIEKPSEIVSKSVFKTIEIITYELRNSQQPRAPPDISFPFV